MYQALQFPPYVPYTLPELADVPAPIAGDDGKAVTYRHAFGDFVYTSFEAAGAVSAHVGLADPHTQYALAASLGTMATQAEAGYALLAGRAGGQTLYGGNAANNDLILNATSHATLTSAYVILQSTGGKVGVGGIPAAAFDVITNLANAFQVSRTDGRFFYIGAASAARMEFGAYNGSVSEYHPIRLTGKTIEWIVGAGGAAGMMLISDTGVSQGHVVTATAWADIAASTTARASLRLRTGVAPTSPNAGDMWTDGIDFYGRGAASYSFGAVVRTTAIRPLTDSTTALQMQNAAGTAIVTVDTTNRRVGIGNTAPLHPLDISGSSGVYAKIRSTTPVGDAAFLTVNDTGASFNFGILGSSNGAYGAMDAANAYFYGTVPFAMTTEGSAIKFGVGGGVPERMRITNTGNLGFGTTDQFGGGVKVVGIADATTVPTTNPTGGGVLYVEEGSLKFRGSSGTVTVLAAA